MKLRLEFLEDGDTVIGEVNVPEGHVPVPAVGDRVIVKDQGEWEVEDRLFMYGTTLEGEMTKVTFYCKRPN